MIRVASAGFVLLVALGVSAVAQSAHPDIVGSPADVKWGPVPPNLPAGAQLAVLSGNPAAAGPFVIRLKMPAGYRVAAHHHPATEYVTVIAGDFHAGMGDALDEKQAMAIMPGGFAALPANMNHFGWAGGETVVQIQGAGPFEIVYADPKDDPTKR